MVSLSTIALGFSVITTGILTLHDTLKQMDHARGFMRFLMTQSTQTNAQYALNCVASALQQRVLTKGEQIKNKISNVSTDMISNSFDFLHTQIEKTLKNISIGTLINYVSQEEQKSVQQQISGSFKKGQQDVISQKLETASKQENSGFWQRIVNYKNAIQLEIQKQYEQYNSLRRQKQQETLMYLYDKYKQKRGIYNDKFISPLNMLMMICLSFGSFFFPKLTIILALSYFISTEIYLLSDLIIKATKSQRLKNLKFENVVEFHLAILGAAFSYNKYQVYKQNKTRQAVPRYGRNLSVSF